MTSSVVCARMMISAGFAGRALGITAFFGWLGMGMGGPQQGMGGMGPPAPYGGPPPGHFQQPAPYW